MVATLMSLLLGEENRPRELPCRRQQEDPLLLAFLWLIHGWVCLNLEPMEKSS